MDNSSTELHKNETLIVLTYQDRTVNWRATDWDFSGRQGVALNNSNTDEQLLISANCPTLLHILINEGATS